MCVGLGVPVSFRQSEVNYVDYSSFVAFADHKIISLDVSMDETLAMDGLQPAEDLKSNLQDGANAEVAIEALENILERTLEEIDDHKYFFPLITVVVELGDAG